MDWVVASIIAGGAIWVASRVLPGTGGAGDRCARCGAPMDVTDEGLELVRLGLAAGVPVSCPVCGLDGQLAVSGLGDDPWSR